jgi:hypothetical protein
MANYRLNVLLVSRPSIQALKSKYFYEMELAIKLWSLAGRMVNPTDRKARLIDGVPVNESIKNICTFFVKLS